ncbi:type IV pilin [Natronomonas marina]|jgi:flagellin-like protein|uniref:type IV pilin n=1 Tax=Natronomonas marina TaxID=2961939 RepID=UPI0020CA0CF3|nr:type IV pilin N-terminal domain-containing protein [Natronomonas marina]
MGVPTDRSRAAARGISPVIGVVLLASITVVLAALVATMAIGFQGKLQDPAPNGGFDQDYQPSGADNTDDRPYVEITHQVGRVVDAENIVIKDESGNTITWNDVWTGGPQVRAGEYVHLDGFASDGVLDPICEEGDTYWIILKNDEGETLMVNEWTAPTDPDLPPGSDSDDDGDGIPNWC